MNEHTHHVRVQFSAHCPEEFKYFEEYARRFPDNPPAMRYGILPYGAELKTENMLYADDPRTLRDKHVDYILDHPKVLRGTLSDFRNFLTWLEKIEGKA